MLDNIRLGAFVRYTNARPKGDVESDLQKAREMFPRLKGQGVTMLPVEQFAAVDAGGSCASLFKIAPNIHPIPALRCCPIRSGWLLG